MEPKPGTSTVRARPPSSARKKQGSAVHEDFAFLLRTPWINLTFNVGTKPRLARRQRHPPGQRLVSNGLRPKDRQARQQFQARMGPRETTHPRKIRMIANPRS